MWDFNCEDGYQVLIYKGNKPSEALDKLIQGPTVIDCGMFCQLSIWFGIRYMLGNSRFDELFGRSALYLTQLVNVPIDNASQPYRGNPLFQFFKRPAEEVNHPYAVVITHIKNHSDYRVKHLGGNYGGDNCVVVGGEYSIFDPTVEETCGLKRADVQRLLLRAFNAPLTTHDVAKIRLLEEADSATVHPRFGLKYGELVSMSKEHTTQTLTEDEFGVNTPIDIGEGTYLQFDFGKFAAWLEQMQRQNTEVAEYVSLPSVQLRVPSDFIQKLPYENKGAIAFDTFDVDTPLQAKIIQQARKFCHDVMAGRSVFITLTGQAGIGKTASAVVCAKELLSRGKKVIWISEVTVHGWAAKAGSLEELNACQDEIQRLLTSDLDAVFLDDNNLVGFAGIVLLEEVYKWYVGNPGKGLYLTSNEPVTFSDCYGFKPDGSYHYPPFLGYTSVQYVNSLLNEELNGQSMRTPPVVTINNRSDHAKLAALRTYNPGSSAGVIVSNESYQRMKHWFSEIEFVPGFPSNIFPPMIQHILFDGTPGPVFDALTPNQKIYTKRFSVTKHVWSHGSYLDTGRYSFTSIVIRSFDQTSHSIIAVELLQEIHWSGKEIINEDCLRQLLIVINYAHDTGGKKVIVVNNTRFAHEELLEKIKEGIPERERERTLARVDTLLFSPKLAELARQNIVIREDFTELKQLYAAQALSSLVSSFFEDAVSQNERVCTSTLQTALFFMLIAHLLKQQDKVRAEVSSAPHNMSGSGSAFTAYSLFNGGGNYLDIGKNENVLPSGSFPYLSLPVREERELIAFQRWGNMLKRLQKPAPLSSEMHLFLRAAVSASPTVFKIYLLQAELMRGHQPASPPLITSGRVKELEPGDNYSDTGCDDQSKVPLRNAT